MDYLSKLNSFYGTHRRMPTYQEMTKLFGFKSKNAVYKVVEKLVEAGTIAKDHLGRLTPTSLFGEVKMLGYIEAGIPSPAEEYAFDSVTLDDWLINDRESTYVLKVKGDSMVDAGIFEGDFVLVERTEKAKVGDVVVAEVDGSWTLKYLRRDAQGRTYLQPGNKKYSNIYPEENMRIGAVVRSVIRRY
jgi:repressor LexA